MRNGTNGNAETVHVTFGCSIADTLRKALPLLGRTERVVGLPGTLSVGPIDPPDPALRQAWGKSILRAESMLWDEFDGDPRRVENTWAETTALSINPVFWVNFSSPMEHACFLAFAARRQSRSLDIVDATNLDFTTAGGVKSPRSLGMMRVQDIVVSDLYRMRRSVLPDELLAASAAWSQLRRENAPFRIVSDGRLVSAHLAHYDGLLVSQASQDWEVAAQLIGRAIGRISSDTALDGQDTSDVVLFGRTLALDENGLLEIRGPGPGMRDYQVRRSMNDPVRHSAR